MRSLPLDDDGRPYDPDRPKRYAVKCLHPTRGASVHYFADSDALRDGIMKLLEQHGQVVKVTDRDPRCVKCGARKPSVSAGCPVRKSIGARAHDRAHPSGGRNNPTKVAKEGRAAWGYRICSRCQGYGWDRMNRPCKPCGGSGQVHKGVMKHGRRPNPSHPDCPGVSSSHWHTQGKCATDWNWGVGTMSRQARKVWPRHHAYAIVQPAAIAGRWEWKVFKSGGNFVGEGESGSSNAAKAAAVEFVKHQRWVLGPRRRNPAVGAWVSHVGDKPVSVRAGDRIEYYTSEPGGRLRRKQGTVVPYLVFDDHVMTNGSNNGDHVDDRNFIRVVRKAARRNPILSVISNPLLSIASNPNHHRRSKRTKARFASRTTPLCKACVRESTSGGVEPLDSSLRAARPKERCGAWDCVRRPRPTQR